jgi:hypothetical protein
VDDGVDPPARIGESTRIGLRTGRGDEHRWRWFVLDDPNVSRTPARSAVRRTRLRTSDPTPVVTTRSCAAQ